MRYAVTFDAMSSPERATCLIVIVAVAMFGLAVPASAGNPAPSEIEREFTGLLNQERASRGLSAVEISPTLTDIADDYAAYNDQVGGIDHGRDPAYTDRAQASGCSEYSWQGPVLHGGDLTARETLDSWLDSKGHADVLLDPEITHLGAGFGVDNRLVYGLPCPAGLLHSSGDFGSAFDGGGGTDPTARTVSLRTTSKGHFKGKVASADPVCVVGVTVEVLRIRRGAEALFGTDDTNAAGSFKVPAGGIRGKYIARVTGAADCAEADSSRIKLSR